MDVTAKWCVMLLIIFVNSEKLKFNENQIVARRAGLAEYQRYLRKNLRGCSPDEIMSHCSQLSNDRYDECAQDLCSRCILQASVLNPYAYYCYWMMSCICTVTTCQDLSQIECY